MYCDFQPAFLFLLTQGTKRKHSSALANYKTKNIFYNKENRELGMKNPNSLFLYLIDAAREEGR